MKDPREVVKAGDIVKVKVMEVDAERKRIGLSMRLTDKADEQVSRGAGGGSDRPRKQRPARQASQNQAPAANNAFASAFAAAKKKCGRL